MRKTIAALCLIFFSGIAHAQTACLDKLNSDSTLSEHLLCLKESLGGLVAENERLRAEVAELEQSLPGASSTPMAIPVGAVVAFDRENGCPEGWIDVGLHDRARFAGRAIIAAGPRVDRDANGTTLERGFDNQGGEEEHKLTKSEMPNHDHGWQDNGHAHPQGVSANFGNGGPAHRVDFSGDGAGALRYSQGISTDPARTGIRFSSDGGEEPHNNMQPYIALYFCRK